MSNKIIPVSLKNAMHWTGFTKWYIRFQDHWFKCWGLIFWIWGKLAPHYYVFLMGSVPQKHSFMPWLVIVSLCIATSLVDIEKNYSQKYEYVDTRITHIPSHITGRNQESPGQWYFSTRSQSVERNKRRIFLVCVSHIFEIHIHQHNDISVNNLKDAWRVIGKGGDYIDYNVVLTIFTMMISQIIQFMVQHGTSL